MFLQRVGKIVLLHWIALIIHIHFDFFDATLSSNIKDIRKETREAIVYKIAEDMLRKLPRDYVPHEIKEALIRLGGLLPMNIFLRQEIDRMQKILSIGTIV